MKRVLVFDIETKRDERYVTPERLQAIRDEITAPANYKDPQKIGAYIGEEFQKQLAKLNCRPMTGRIVGIGCAFLDGGPGGTDVWGMASDDEAELIDAFYGQVEATTKGRDVILTGYNVRRFDIPYLAIRAAVHGLGVRWWPRARDYRLVCDPLDDLLQEGKLEAWLDRFGLPAKTADGSEVENMTLGQIAEYVRNDVFVERELVRRLRDQLPIIRDNTGALT